MNQIRMVVSDLDGTLLDEHHQLSAALTEKIRRYINRGGLFTLATGRNWAATRAIAKTLTVRLPMILCNGAVLADEQQIYYRAEIPAPGMKELFADAQQAGLSILLFEHEQIYGMGNPEGIARFSRKEKLTCKPALADEAFLSGLHMIKAALVGPYETSLSLWEKHREGYRGAYGCVRTESDFFEIVRQGENKGGACCGWRCGWASRRRKFSPSATI